MKNIKKIAVALLVTVMSVGALSGCGGGGGAETGTGSSQPLPSKVMSWVPPAVYSDNTPLNPTTDLISYEVFVNRTGLFSPSDSPTAVVAAADSQTHQPYTTFDLANLNGFLTKGVTYYVAMRSVAIDGARSEFSLPATFSF